MNENSRLQSNNAIKIVHHDLTAQSQSTDPQSVGMSHCFSEIALRQVSLIYTSSILHSLSFDSVSSLVVTSLDTSQS